MKLTKKIGLTCALALGGIAIAVPMATTIVSCSSTSTNEEKPTTKPETTPENNKPAENGKPGEAGKPEAEAGPVAPGGDSHAAPSPTPGTPEADKTPSGK